MRISRIKKKKKEDDTMIFTTTDLFSLVYPSTFIIFFVYPVAVIHCHLVVGQSSIGFLTASTFIITLNETT